MLEARKITHSSKRRSHKGKDTYTCQVNPVADTSKFTVLTVTSITVMTRLTSDEKQSLFSLTGWSSRGGASDANILLLLPQQWFLMMLNTIHRSTSATDVFISFSGWRYRSDGGCLDLMECKPKAHV